MLKLYIADISGVECTYTKRVPNEFRKWMTILLGMV